MPQRRTREELAAVFWRQVEKSGPIVSDVLGPCWLWTGTVNGGGYGSIEYHRPLINGAHRASWYLHHGVLSPDLHVCHKCDVRRCVRPDHLFLGTCADNSRDCVAKGRHSGGAKPGIRYYKVKLTEQQVREIKRAISSGEQQKDIAERLSLSRATISDINCGRTWSDVSI